MSKLDSDVHGAMEVMNELGLYCGESIQRAAKGNSILDCLKYPSEVLELYRLLRNSALEIYSMQNKTGSCNES